MRLINAVLAWLTGRHISPSQPRAKKAGNVSDAAPNGPDKPAQPADDGVPVSNPEMHEVKPMTYLPEVITPYLPMARRRIDMLVIHCLATMPYMDFGMNDVTQWHTAPKPRGRGWKYPGYHGLFRFDGKFERGRDVDIAGAHARGFNARSIGVALVGGLDGSKRPSPDAYTRAQWRELRKFVDEFKAMYPDAKIVGHNELGNKACPSFSVQDWLKDGSIVAVK